MNTRLTALAGAFTVVLGGGLGAGLPGVLAQDATARAPEEVVEELPSEDLWQYGWHGHRATNRMHDAMTDHMPGQWPDVCDQIHRNHPHHPGQGPGPGPGGPRR